jgi:hypothetical protein
MREAGGTDFGWEDAAFPVRSVTVREAGFDACPQAESRGNAVSEKASRRREGLGDNTRGRRVSRTIKAGLERVKPR